MNLHKPCTIPVHIVIYRNAYYIEMNITINALHFIVKSFKNNFSNVLETLEDA